MKNTLAVIFILIFVAALVSAQLGGIGYGLYLWAYGSTFAMAAWTGFMLWLKLLLLAFVSGVTAELLKT